VEHHPGQFTASLAIQLPRNPTELPTGYNVQLFPEGQFAASDGRPGNIQGCQTKTWFMDATIAPDIIADVDARQARPVVDYEHQSIRSRENGQPAPAAGWIQALAYFPGQGLFAKATWTDRARACITSGEYRYFSPFFEFDDKNGAVRRFINAALTNTPALDGLMAVAASLDLDGNTPAPILVEAAITEGLLPKALKGWAVDLGTRHPQKLRAFLGKLRPGASSSLKGASRAALSDADREAARLLGRTEAEFLKDKRLIALVENPVHAAALSLPEKEAARLLGLTEVEYLARKELL
jgi:phage I-like protein